VSAVSEILRSIPPADLAARIGRLPEDTQDEFLALLEAESRDDIDRRCGERVVEHDRGPMYWLRTLTKTKNFHWQKQGLTAEQSVAPFPFWKHPNAIVKPEWDYLDWLMFYMLDSFEQGYDLYVPKARQMLTSWEAVGYVTWSCQFFPNVQAVGQSEKDDKAQGLIAYANALYENQPEWLRLRHPLKRGDSGTQHEIQWANGSEFIAVPQGERQTASYHPTIFFSDEAAHQPAWKATINIVKPVAKQVVCVSSAAFSEFGLSCDPSLAL
jgi:hypothetical protein